ncbi:unnamed protein product [Clonostachys chloroleuca]|uniref:Uncharacterized protein n=1 Tax=Clonostachys chloroleuca TaxID=1926264 RepID=A0AA35PZK2_9HYPO|nr:unnamed protein product [Clonostachys chloroleuca]
MGNTPGPDSSPDDEAGLARKRPRSPDPETEPEPGHVPKKQRHTSSISSKAAKPARPSKKRALSPECDDSLGPGGDGGDIARKRRRPKQDAEQTSSQSRRSAAQFLPTPPPPPPAALLDQEHSRSVAHIQRIRSGLQDIERRLARLAQLCATRFWIHSTPASQLTAIHGLAFQQSLSTLHLDTLFLDASLLLAGTDLIVTDRILPIMDMIMTL